MMSSGLRDDGHEPGSVGLPKMAGAAACDQLGERRRAPA